MAGSKTLDFYALSRGISLKPARNLIATVQWQSQRIDVLCLTRKHQPQSEHRVYQYVSIG